MAPGAPSGALSHLGVAGYRSLQQLVLPLGPLTLVCGVNGCGKSNVYRGLGLIAAAARGELVAALAAEGGLPAVIRAGLSLTQVEEFESVGRACLVASLDTQALKDPDCSAIAGGH